MYQLDDLVYLMARLRNPETGCPWDLKQDFASVLPHTLEEAYEVADAIERRDWPHLEEELGDLLFQVVFYGQLGKEQGDFTLFSIIDRLVSKLIRRHPHVFPEGDLRAERSVSETPDDGQIRASWEAIKAEERAEKLARGFQTVESQRLLDQVPVALPALARAVKLQKKAATVGFDWTEKQQILDKIEEELLEVKEEMRSGDQQRIQDEIGDLLFAVTNLARHYDIDPDAALRGTNVRFKRRFDQVEQAVETAGGWEVSSLEAMEAAWQEAKKKVG